jgi:hypothetical protein
MSKTQEKLLMISKRIEALKDKKDAEFNHAVNAAKADHKLISQLSEETHELTQLLAMFDASFFVELATANGGQTVAA